MSQDNVLAGISSNDHAMEIQNAGPVAPDETDLAQSGIRGRTTCLQDLFQSGDATFQGVNAGPRACAPQRKHRAIDRAQHKDALAEIFLHEDLHTGIPDIQGVGSGEGPTQLRVGVVDRFW